MIRFIKLFLLVAVVLFAQGCEQNSKKESPAKELKETDKTTVYENPSDISITQFAGHEITPSPACLAVASTGEVFVGVDMMGSLGKEPGKGSIIKLIDSDNDGKADEHTVFTEVDNPRGIISIGDQLFVLHTTFSSETGIATGMDLVVFEDKNNDGIADGPSKLLVENICAPAYIVKRGTDHATNGIRMGIDGWIYIAVGDFGFHNATDRSGKKMTMLGGGIVRVRPDGTEMEVYTHGMRNIYDMAIDPYMNIYTRGNTNDGGGWNIRFVHHIQSGEYGYPVLFKHFTDEIIPALVDVGGGSGTGSLFMDDPNWPDKYNKVPMMADWGRSHLFIHRVSEDGASFKQIEEQFIKLAQITDLDVDASGRLYMSAWDGAGFRGNPGKGFIVRATPENWKYKASPNFKESSIDELANLLKSKSASIRLSAQQELLTRSENKAAAAAWKVASDSNLPLDSRVAGIFTYAQISGSKGIENLIKLNADKAVREFTLRALADRTSAGENVPLAPFIEGVKDTSVRVQTAAIIGLGRLGRPEAATALLKTKAPASAIFSPKKGTEGPHATPNAAIIPAHLAVRALVVINAVEACLDAVQKQESTLALWALKYMHSGKAVDGLIEAYNNSNNSDYKNLILITLSRIYKKEAPYDGSWWWSTRPDTHGPYYKSITWEASQQIETFLVKEWKKASVKEKELFADLNGKHRMGITVFGGEEDLITKKDQKIDLAKIKNKKGQVGLASIEDVMLAMADIKGDSKEGIKLFTQQGCIACHSIKKEETLKGPFMGQIGSIMTRDQIAESILKPNASISQGFSSVVIKTKDGKNFTGFITAESAEKLVLRTITGDEFTIKTHNISIRNEIESSMMPSGLANALSYEEFASLITFLSEQKK
jgi:putative heme-binding domain-containing protein